MSSPPSRAKSPATIKLLEILSDGEWHRRDELVVKAGAFIQPGIALRAREKNRKRDRARYVKKGDGSKNPPIQPERSHEYQIAVGRKFLISETLSHLANLEIKVDDEGTRWVRSTRPAPKESHHQ